MAVRAYSPVLPSVELFGAYEGIVSATGVNQKVSLTFTPTTGNLTIVPYDGDDNISQLQLEVGSTPSSYIPTLVSSTVTRAADTMTIPAVNMPWPSPVVIGLELVTNGTFDDGATGYVEVLNGTISYASATMFATATTNNTGVYQDVAVGAGSTCEVSWDQVSGTNLRIAIYDGASFSTNRYSNGVGNSDIGTKTAVVVSTTGTLRLYLHTSTGNTAEFDNISVREINPLAVSIQMEGTMTYADRDLSVGADPNSGEVQFIRWAGGTYNNYIIAALNTSSTKTGVVRFQQEDTNNIIDNVETADVYSPGINVPFNIASRHGSTFINGAVDGTALTANLTPTALPDLSATNMQIGYDFMGTIKLFRVWADDLTDAGIAEASA